MALQYNLRMRSIVSYWSGLRRQRKLTGWGCSQCAWFQELPVGLAAREIAGLDLLAHEQFRTHDCSRYPTPTEAQKQPSTASKSPRPRLTA